MWLVADLSDACFKDKKFDVSQNNIDKNLTCSSFELTNFLSAPYHHHVSRWELLLAHLILLSKRIFWCTTKLFCSKFDLFLFWAYKFLQCFVSSSKVLIRLIFGSPDSSFKDKNFDVSQYYFTENLICYSFEPTNCLNAPYHHQGLHQGLHATRFWFFWFAI